METIDIPFGAHDSELKGWEYTIPEGYTAEIKDGKIIVKEKKHEDERIRKEIISLILKVMGQEKDNLSDDKYDAMLAYLEKQKENPKSADSIPSDCVSDAKCEDRWHKVEDSLPDNPREVLCKDEAGNYFIGRYYVGEGWEISNYDDEDKPHHLNPPVSKWIDFTSEKQKEQKQYDIDVLEKHITKDSVSELAHTVIIRNGWEIVEANEQKPADWSEEDEKMIERLTRILELGSKGFHADYTKEGYAEAYSWLKSLPLNLKKKNEDVAKLCSNEWSEEDERMLSRCVKSIESSKQFADSDTFKKAKDNEVAWLKSLRPHPHWEPSEKQMNVLKEAADMHWEPDGLDPLYSLYNDLKKLMKYDRH